MQRLLALALVSLFLIGTASAETYDALVWRPIGPYRGGRTKAAAGVPQRPGTFYIGACDGGVWKTTDYGRTWQPIFDDQPTGSIGALAVAPSNPDVVYVGSGEGLQRPDLSTGDGVYKSTDAGKTWTHLGLRDGQQIPQIAVDPRNPDRLFVAVLGHPYGPNEERGIFRSLDGGKSFQKVLYKDADTGGADVVIDPQNPAIVYAVLWETRQAPWENGDFNGPGSGLFKSTDGGSTWRPLTKGLPTFAGEKLGRIGVHVAPANARRLFATVEAEKKDGLYRSDDAGESWTRITDDDRVVERGDDFAEVKTDPRDADVVYTASVVAWKSTDGGKTFTAFRGAPGGDDYQRIWIDPTRSDVILIASDQGAIITVNGGRSWSSWYNQPTAQMFHATVDNAFPYRVCGGQQESGSACVASRGNDGQITFREWHPVGVEEYGYAAPDPLDPDVVYGGKVSRHDRRTGQTQDVSPVASGAPDFRTIRTQPIVFAPTDPHTLYFAANTVWKTTDGGLSWKQISADLTRATWDVPASVGKYRGDEHAKPSRRGVIYALAPSYVDRNTIWAGTDDGLIHVTRDGGRAWKDVTPPELGPWMKVSIMDAGRFDAATAYAAVNTLRLDDLKPHVFRTHDGGKSWTPIVAGLPDGGIVNVVREDPRRRGLLYAGTEQAVYVSFDDGDHWQSLRRNMPATSIRDLVVKDDDVVVATHGRGFWILDDVTPLRQELAGDVALLAPARAWRVRWSMYTDTPLPPDEPTSPNPPDGAILDYWLRAPARVVTLEVLDGAGALMRRFSTADPAPPPIADYENIPRWWIRPAPRLGAEAGLHRFVWDLHRAPPVDGPPYYPIGAVPGNTAAEPRGPWVVPGSYTVRLTVDGQARSQKLEVRMDPRVKTPLAALQKQSALSIRLADGMERAHAGYQAAKALAADLDKRGAAEAAKQAAALAGPDRLPWFGTRTATPSLGLTGARLASLYGRVQQADVAPTPQLAAAAEAQLKALDELLAQSKKLRAANPNP